MSSQAADEAGGRRPVVGSWGRELRCIAMQPEDAASHAVQLAVEHLHQWSLDEWRDAKVDGPRPDLCVETAEAAFLYEAPHVSNKDFQYVRLQKSAEDARAQASSRKKAKDAEGAALFTRVAGVYDSMRQCVHGTHNEATERDVGNLFFSQVCELVAKAESLMEDPNMHTKSLAEDFEELATGMHKLLGRKAELQSDLRAVLSGASEVGADEVELIAGKVESCDRTVAAISQQLQDVMNEQIARYESLETHIVAQFLECGCTSRKQRLRARAASNAKEAAERQRQIKIKIADAKDQLDEYLSSCSAKEGACAEEMKSLYDRRGRCESRLAVLKMEATEVFRGIAACVRELAGVEAEERTVREIQEHNADVIKRVKARYAQEVADLEQMVRDAEARESVFEIAMERGAAILDTLDVIQQRKQRLLSSMCLSTYARHHEVLVDLYTHVDSMHRTCEKLMQNAALEDTLKLTYARGLADDDSCSEGDAASRTPSAKSCTSLPAPEQPHSAPVTGAAAFLRTPSEQHNIKRGSTSSSSSPAKKTSLGDLFGARGYAGWPGSASLSPKKKSDGHHAAVGRKEGELVDKKERMSKRIEQIQKDLKQAELQREMYDAKCKQVASALILRCQLQNAHISEWSLSPLTKPTPDPAYSFLGVASTPKSENFDYFKPHSPATPTRRDSDGRLPSIRSETYRSVHSVKSQRSSRDLLTEGEDTPDDFCVFLYGENDLPAPKLNTIQGSMEGLEELSARMGLEVSEEEYWVSSQGLDYAATDASLILLCKRDAARETLTQHGVAVKPGSEYILRVCGVQCESGESVLGATVTCALTRQVIKTHQSTFFGNHAAGWNDPQLANMQDDTDSSGCRDYVDGLELNFAVASPSVDVSLFISPAREGTQVHVQCVELLRKVAHTVTHPKTACVRAFLSECEEENERDNRDSQRKLRESLRRRQELERMRESLLQQRLTFPGESPRPSPQLTPNLFVSPSDASKMPTLNLVDSPVIARHSEDAKSDGAAQRCRSGASDVREAPRDPSGHARGALRESRDAPHDPRSKARGAHREARDAPRDPKHETHRSASVRDTREEGDGGALEEALERQIEMQKEIDMLRSKVADQEHWHATSVAMLQRVQRKNARFSSLMPQKPSSLPLSGAGEHPKNEEKQDHKEEQRQQTGETDVSKTDGAPASQEASSAGDADGVEDCVERADKRGAGAEDCRQACETTTASNEGARVEGDEVELDL